MRKLIILAALVLFAAAPVAMAETAQQGKMKSCNADAKTKNLAGDERKAFMKQCLSAKAEAKEEKKLTPQQQKMKDCNAQAKDKKGDERKKFMKTCLSGK
ncbi:MAG: PsiF family protein [Burkholderiales bacterium]